MSYGVQPEGFVIKPTDVIKSETEGFLKAGPLGASAGTEPDNSIPARSVAGQVVALVVDVASSQWELQQAVYASSDPAQATDDAQDKVCSLTGVLRQPAEFSRVTGTCIGTNNTLLRKGRAATVTTAGTRFASVDDRTIVTLASWAALNAYALDALITNGSKVYKCITPGVSDAISGPTGTATNITDGTVHWRYMGAGTAAVDVIFSAAVAGALEALAGELATIATPVAGWSSVSNAHDAVLGILREGNDALRVRREGELALATGGPSDAIRARILKVGDGSTDPTKQVQACTVFYNDTDATDANGVPPHSVEVLVRGGVAADIAAAIFACRSAGTSTYGNQTSSVTDSQGTAHPIYWSRPTEVPIYIVVTAIYDATQWPASPDAAISDAVKGALVTFGETFQIGVSVRLVPLAAAVDRGPTSSEPGATPAPGIIDVDPLHFGTAPAPVTSTTVAIGVRQVATFDSANISVTATPGTP